VQRIDEDDEVYRTGAEKLKAILREIESASQNMQPMLVGTTSIEKSEQLAEFMQANGYKLIDFEDPNGLLKLYEAARNDKPSKLFAVLNARFHEQEAYIVAEAGVPGAITIATNMAGRGTDIQLGGNVDMRVQHECAAMEAGPERDAREASIRAEVAMFRDKAKAAGGLYIVGTERHESRRIDNQLRGRGGRQGDPGRSKFFLSLQDDLMRIFGSDRMDSMLTRLGLKEDEAIVHPWINKALEKAQQKVEARNFDMRKNILKYDNVMNDQRKVVFEQRREMMALESLEETVANMRGNVIDDIVNKRIPKDSYPDAWDVAGLNEDVQTKLGLELPIADWVREDGIAEEEIAERLHKAADESYAARTEKNTPDVMRFVEKQVVLQVLDHFWREHLVMLDHLRQVIGWRGYAQRDPLNEYKSEAFELFNGLINQWHELATAQLMRVEVAFEQQPDPAALEASSMGGEASLDEINALIAAGALSPQSLGLAEERVGAEARNPQDPSSWGKVGRNEACPCGSGKKYKHCHGVFA
jgi:preprotein translocase subunit SecA